MSRDYRLYLDDNLDSFKELGRKPFDVLESHNTMIKYRFPGKGKSDQANRLH